MIKNFSKEVSEEIKCYVYRLIDPRNGRTFYVGKGGGGRVFEHVKNAKSDEEERYKKNKIITEIEEEGLEVIHVIHRWGLESKEAELIESALIDAYPGLTNIQRGHDCEKGVINAEVLQRKIEAKVYDEPDDFKYIIIKVGENSVNDQIKNNVEEPRYEATRKWWNLTTTSVKDYKYVFSVTDGIVKEVYEVEKWEKDPDPDSKRIGFCGKRASEEIRERFIHKKIPGKYCKQGQSNPCQYSKND